jgi:hypothetical protein
MTSLFPKIKVILKGRHFYDVDDVRGNRTAALKAIVHNQFQKCFEGWTWSWLRCIASRGGYFESDHSELSNDVCSTFTAMSSRTLLPYHVLRTKHVGVQYNHDTEEFFLLEYNSV